MRQRQPEMSVPLTRQRVSRRRVKRGLGELLLCFAATQEDAESQQQ